MNSILITIVDGHLEIKVDGQLSLAQALGILELAKQNFLNQAGMTHAIPDRNNTKDTSGTRAAN